MNTRRHIGTEYLMIFSRRLFLCLMGFLLSLPPPQNMTFASDMEPSADQGYYRFLQPLPHARGTLPANGSGGEEGKGQDDSSQSAESREMTQERSKIRSLLRLVDGDTVPVNERMYVQLLGVQFASYNNDGDSGRSETIIKRIKEWIFDFMENPEDALRNYEGMNSKVNYKDGKGKDLSFFYLYVPDFALDEVRRRGLRDYEAWLKNKRTKKSLPPESRAPGKDKAAGDSVSFKDKLLSGSSSGEKPGDVQEYVVSEAKYYYGNGTIKKAEVYKNGKLALIRNYDERGRMLKEEAFDPEIKAVQSK